MGALTPLLFFETVGRFADGRLEVRKGRFEAGFRLEGVARDVVLFLLDDFAADDFRDAVFGMAFFTDFFFNAGFFFKGLFFFAAMVLA